MFEYCPHTFYDMYCYYGMSRLLLSGTGANIIVGEFAVTKRHMHDAIVDRALKALIRQALLLGASGVARIIAASSTLD
ncbi:MAG TPA: hypothetical protein DIW64_06540 [Cellvibrio sp.]|nr:hypothetical protein [Cellvibrio sp.]